MSAEHKNPSKVVQEEFLTLPIGETKVSSTYRRYNLRLRRHVGPTHYNKIIRDMECIEVGEEGGLNTFARVEEPGPICEKCIYNITKVTRVGGIERCAMLPPVEE